MNRWQFRIQLLWIPPLENLCVGITIAYQHKSIAASRAIFLSFFFVTLSIGWTYL
jgi:hypothetical protein